MIQTNVIYAVALASASLALLFWRALCFIDAPTRRALFSFLRKVFLYRSAYRRRAGSDGVTVVSSVNVLIFIAANITACTFGLTDRAELAKRCGNLSVINLIPLLLGGRTSLLVDRILQIQPYHSSFMHRWMGRICVVQGLVHGVLKAVSDPRVTVIQSLVCL
jgi:hypothetical protein